MIFSLPCFNFRFTPNRLMIILTLLFCSFFVSLGQWQLHRAREKEQMMAAEQAMRNKKPERFLHAQSALPKPYQRLQMRGHFLSPFFLLDNQHHQHRFGYDVLALFNIEGGGMVLVDRGFIYGDITRQTFPGVNTPEGPREVRGSVYFPAKNTWVLGPSWEEKDNNIIIIERIDLKLLSQILQKKLYPFIIRLDKVSPDGFVREWPVVAMRPERHVAYAIQWFVFAFITFILFIALNIKKKNV